MVTWLHGLDFLTMFWGGVLVGVPTATLAHSWKAGMAGYVAGMLLVLCAIIIAIRTKGNHAPA